MILASPGAPDAPGDAFLWENFVLRCMERGMLCPTGKDAFCCVSVRIPESVRHWALERFGIRRGIPFLDRLDRLPGGFFAQTLLGLFACFHGGTSFHGRLHSMLSLATSFRKGSSACF